MRDDAPQREHDLRDGFNGLRWMVRTGAPWRYIPNHFPPWEAIYQQTQRWIAAGVFESMVNDLRLILRMAAGKEPYAFSSWQCLRFDARMEIVPKRV